MNGLTIEEVEHVADLANLVLTEEEKQKFSRQLNDILDDIDKISSVNIKEENKPVIAPTNNHDQYHKDETEKSLTMEEIIKNANKTSGDYITVPGALDD